MFNSRPFNLILAFFCYQLLIAAFYFQYVEGMKPCPLCIFQRVIVFILGLLFFIQALHRPILSDIWSVFYNSFGLLTSIIGFGISARHAYLQSLPADEIPACGPSLNYLIEMLSFYEVFDVVLKGSGECAEVSWRLLGLSMPMWMFLFFGSLIMLYIGRFWIKISLRKREWTVIS
jgi:disulfide bond formation protein DsbB